MLNDSHGSVIHSISSPDSHGIALTWNQSQPHLHGNESPGIQPWPLAPPRGRKAPKARVAPLSPAPPDPAFPLFPGNLPWNLLPGVSCRAGQTPNHPSAQGGWQEMDSCFPDRSFSSKTCFLPFQNREPSRIFSLEIGF